MKSATEFTRSAENFKKAFKISTQLRIFISARNGARLVVRVKTNAREKQLAMFPAADNTSGILRTFNKCGGGWRVLFKIIVSTDAVDKIYRGTARGNRPR